MQVQTLADLKCAMAQKIKITKTAFEVSAKADTPEEAVALVVSGYKLYQANKERFATPVPDKPRAEFPALVKEADGGYILKHGDGAVSPWDPSVLDFTEDYRVKIEFAANTKGIGWDVSVKGASMEENFALLAYTEDLLRQALPVAVETKAG